MVIRRVTFWYEVMICGCILHNAWIAFSMKTVPFRTQIMMYVNKMEIVQYLGILYTIKKYAWTIWEFYIMTY